MKAFKKKLKRPFLCSSSSSSIPDQQTKSPLSYDYHPKSPNKPNHQTQHEVNGDRKGEHREHCEEEENEDCFCSWDSLPPLPPPFAPSLSTMTSSDAFAPRNEGFIHDDDTERGSNDPGINTDLRAGFNGSNVNNDNSCSELEGTWYQNWDPHRKAYYYYNDVKKVSQWYPPNVVPLIPEHADDTGSDYTTTENDSIIECGNKHDKTVKEENQFLMGDVQKEKKTPAAMARTPLTLTIPDYFSAKHNDNASYVTAVTTSSITSTTHTKVRQRHDDTQEPPTTPASVVRKNLSQLKEIFPCASPTQNNRNNDNMSEEYILKCYDSGNGRASNTTGTTIITTPSTTNSNAAATPTSNTRLFECSITMDLMRDPVIAADGHTYERMALEQWLSTHNTSPATNEMLEHRLLTPNRALRSMIEEFQEKMDEETCKLT